MIQELYDYHLLDNIPNSATSHAGNHTAVDSKASQVSNELSIDTSDLNNTAAATLL